MSSPTDDDHLDDLMKKPLTARAMSSIALSSASESLSESSASSISWSSGSKLIPHFYNWYNKFPGKKSTLQRWERSVNSELNNLIY